VWWCDGSARSGDELSCVTGRLLFAGIFVLSLLGKAPRRVAYRQFVTATADLLDVGGTTARILAAATVGAETAAVVLVLLPIFPVVGFGLVVALLGCYTVALVRARRRADRVACHCFGASSVRTDEAGTVIMADASMQWLQP
jgi:uncharacterized membrane protein YphA (DoxX/SURF4 family)